MFKILLFKKWNSIFIFVVLMTGITFNTTVFAQSPPVSPYANGTPIVIGSGVGEYPWNISTIYGGAASGTLGSTDLTISNTVSGDQARKVIAGSAAGTITGEAKVTFNGSRSYDIRTVSVANDPAIQIGHLWGGGNAGNVGTGHVIINSGRVRYYVLGGGGGTTGSTTGNTLVEINEVLVGFPPTLPESSGQGEVYGGGMESTNSVTGNTQIKIMGNIYNPATYVAGDPVTLIRQHVCGGGAGSGPLVGGNTLIDVSGGTIYGMVCGGSGGNNGKVNGSTVVNITGGQIRTDGNGGNGGNVYGGSFRGFNTITGGGLTNTVGGNTAVNISDNAYIQGKVCGGGRYTGFYAPSVVNGNATVTITNGIIGGSIYAGGESGSSYVNGIATVILKDMNSSNGFVADFNRSILRGAIGASGKANMVFDNYTTINKAIIGATGTGAFDTLVFKNNSTQIIDPTSNYYSKSWVIGTGSTVEFTANTNTSTTTGTFSNGGLSTLNSSANLTLNLRGNYLALQNGRLVMSATSNTVKDFLQITGTATKDNGNSTTIQLALAPGWDGSRIVLVQAAGTGSEADAFVLGTSLPPIPGRTVGFNSEINGAYRIWYIEAACDPFDAIISGPTEGCIDTEYIFTSNGTETDIDYVWTITNGTILSGQGTNTIGATFTADGTISLKYKNQLGCESSEAIYNIAIDVTVPTPVITGPTTVYTGVEANFSGDGEAISATNYLWGSNSGAIINGQGTNEATIKWDVAGTDVVSLSYSLGNCQGTGTLDVLILSKDSLIDGGFDVNDSIQCYIGNNYVFTNTTTITPPNELVGYLWDFGDGSTSTAANPTHQYARGGIYVVTLIAYGTITNDTVSSTVRVLETVVERPSDQTVCAGNPTQEVVFRGSADLYSWTNSLMIGLPNGSDPVRIPSFIAKNSATHTVIDTITVTPQMSVSDLVCYGDTVKFRIIVNPLTVPTIVGNNDVCSDAEVTYTTESGMSNYEWKVVGGQIVNGGGSTNDFATIRWNSSGQGTVSVNYTNKTGCRLTEGTTRTITFLEKVTIINQPSSSTALCSGDAFNLSVTASGTRLAYQWYLNGNAISGATGSTYNVPSGKPSDSGDYYVIVTGACNSVQSNTVSVHIGIPDIVVQKWENVLAVKSVPSENGGYQFTAFQWYKNDILMQGETKSYLYVSGVIDYSAVYVVKLTTSTGSVFYTCGRTFIPKNQILVNAYPNPVGKGQILNVDISGIADNVGVDWVLTDYKGMFLQRQQLKGNHATITMPGVSGVYILRVNIATSKPESKYFKIIVN